MCYVQQLCCFNKGTFLQIYGVKDFDDQKHS